MQKFRLIIRMAAVLLVGSGTLALSGEADTNAVPRRTLDAGLLFYQGYDVEGNRLKTTAGPFVERRETDTGNSMFAIRPFYSVTRSEERDRELYEYLWPLGMYKKYQGTTYWRFLLAWGHDFDNTQSGSRYRYSIFPLVWGGRNKEGRGYFALFPLGGRIDEFLGQDSVTFGLFPLYLQYRVRDVQTRYFLWPLCYRTRGGGVKRGGVFPFYGYSLNNNLGKWSKRYVMWPFWTSVRYKFPGESGGGFILFPLFGYATVGERTRTLMLVPPLFRFSKGKRGHREVNSPWPFVQYASGDYEKFYMWPLWGRKSDEHYNRWFVLWPILFDKTLYRRQYYARRFLIVPFIQSEARYRYADPGKTKDRKAWGETEDAIFRYLKLWPLLQYEGSDDSARLRVLALWPFKLADNVDRNWSPLWTVYSRERAGPEKEDKLLWGLIRWRRSRKGDRDFRLFPLYADRKRVGPDYERKWNLLYGLAGYKREGLQKQGRLLYVIRWNFGGGHTNTVAGEKANTPEE
jgi:hypothetical protein